MFKHTLAALAFSLLAAALPAQFLEESFDGNLTDGGFTSPDFVFVADGTAAASPDWGNRSRLRSATEGGAAALVGPVDVGTLVSPPFDVNGTELYLSFYHYFRSVGGDLEVRVLDVGGNVVLTVPVVPDLAAGEETSAGKFERLDLSAALSTGSPLQLEFAVTGGASFWLIDDITVTDVRPVYPTFPRYLGEQLTTFGQPFVTDYRGSAAVPFELVIDFAPGTTDAEKEDIRTQLNAVQKQTCVCDRLEVWELPGGDFFDPTTGQPLGDPGTILSGKLGAGSNGKIDNLELNLLSYHELQNEPSPANPPLTPTEIADLPSAPSGAVRVAVLDTGLDLDHPDLAGFVFRGTETLNGEDEDQNCYADDVVGWNFVDDNNNPDDDHSHGTHVAGIVAQNLANCDNCTFRIIPYKTHNSFGVGTLFATACATLQASVNDGAAVINASWGFYGGGSDLLAAAIDTAGNYGTLVVAAAGNDSLNLVADFQHPATFALPNVVSVGTFSGVATAPADRADFSNYNPAFVDLFAPGVAVESAVPGGGTEIKTGTSMSTPAVAAGAALRTCSAGNNPLGTKSYLLSNANGFPVQIGAFVLDGNVLDLGDGCPETGATNGASTGTDFSICYRPETEEVDVRALRPVFTSRIRVVDDGGTVVAERLSVSLQSAERTFLSLKGRPAGNYFVVIAKGSRTLVQRLVKR